MVFPQIDLYYGATSAVDFNLSGFDLQNGTVEFTVRDCRQNLIFRTAFAEQAVHRVVFHPKFTGSLQAGATYYYDLMWCVQNEKYPLCSPSKVFVHETIGGIEDG